MQVPHNFSFHLSPRKAEGVSLVELLITLTIFLVVLGAGIPSFSHMIKSNRAATTINWIVGGIQYTRHSAVTFNTITTICPINSKVGKKKKKCGGKWYEGIVVFIDHNGDAKINGEDRILKRLQYPEEGSTLKWRAFRNRQYLQMTPMGFTNYQNGNFVYCSSDQDPRYSRQIVINLQGRVRKSYDRDGDGLIEDSRGKKLRC